ncbi:hypothetical protein [Rubinisphaera sp.]|uniref:hypothetical protein n=1 Tax=Rubinisphaera sp. TaxID=2024857 RepID=UPI000C0FAFA6|nr:hypothetical protein [Rubinisphaera sp.]MBV07680.1 hypothetical protein [Rubinisphaera sp.]HCS53286.1 hypothetical protein [Planctomycetaceae bacterium]
MATLEEAVRAMLLSLDAVTDLVGDRIRPDILDRSDDPPAILVKVEDEQLHTDLDGQGGLVKAVVVIEAIATTRIESRALERAIRLNGTDPGSGLQGYAGLVGEFDIRCCTLARRKPFFLERESDEDVDWYGIASFYEIEYPEPD